MTSYYLFTGKDSLGPGVSAFAPEGTPLAQDVISDLETSSTLPFSLRLVELTSTESGLSVSNVPANLPVDWLDYLPNSFAWPLFSPQLRAIVNARLTGDEGVDWLTADVIGMGKSRVYYLPRFERPLDVLDFGKTTFVSGTQHVIRPWFSLEKVKNYSMFPLPSEYNLWKITSSLYINEALKNDIQNKGLTGVSFERARAG